MHDVAVSVAHSETRGNNNNYFCLWIKLPNRSTCSSHLRNHPITLTLLNARKRLTSLAGITPITNFIVSLDTNFVDVKVHRVLPYLRWYSPAIVRYKTIRGRHHCDNTQPAISGGGAGCKAVLITADVTNLPAA